MAYLKLLLGKSTKTLGLFIIIIFYCSEVSFSQVFPVQANINVAPPYSVYLSQYTSSDQEKVMVSVLLHDPVITSIDVKFRFIIQGGGIKFTTNPAWNPQPFNLTGGITTILPQELIAEYLKPQNMLLEGVNPQEFYRSGKLPEGFYEFKVEVIEYRRGITISNTGRTGIWLLLNEPPRFVFPLPNQKIQATNPQMLNFTWIPGGVTSPLSNQSTMYEFTLVEMVDKSVDPTVAITTASNASKFVKTVDQTNLFYGPGEMPLTPGKTYAIRVKAYNTEGYEMFKNGGYSEVRTFTFGDACVPPISFELKSPKQSTFDINVYTNPSNTAWQAHFRENTNSEGEWSELKSEPGTNQKTVKGLKPKTTYEVQVKGLCGEIQSGYSLSQTITTSPMADANRSCSGNPTPFAADNAPSLQQLQKDDIFLAALFPIRVKQIKSQGGGKFSGVGIATLPLFNTGLAVTFDNIGINNLMQLTSGEVKVVRDELNITLFGDTPTTTGDGTGQGTTGINGGNNGDTTGYPPITDRDTIPVYDSLRVVNDTTVIVYPPNGGTPVTVNIQANSTTLLIPADGNMNNAQIVYDGAAHPYHPAQGGNNTGDPKNFTGLFARFKAHEAQTHGFDTLKYNIIANYYKQLTIAGNQYYLPWKALKDGTPEPVKLFIKQGTDKMPFTELKVKQTGVGDLTPSVGAGTQAQTYMLSGSYKGIEESVVAYYTADEKENYAGGLYTATYGESKCKLILVPLPTITIDNMKIGGLQQELNQIYSQAVVSWSVSQLTGFTGADLGENGLDWADKDMLSSYNSEMNSLISAFKNWKSDADPDAYYLFIVPKFSEENLEGFMPRNRRFGFVTQSQLYSRTVAHELGHGAFNLHHTFSTSGWAIAQTSTDNLMDYAQGIKLWKPQWDFIHNPEATTGLWDGMEEGASIDATDKIIIEISKLPSKIALNPNCLEFSYQIKNIKALKEKYPKEKFAGFIQIIDKGRNVVFYKTIDDSNTGNVKWNGNYKIDQTERLIKSKDGSFKVIITVFAGPQSLYEQLKKVLTDWESFKAMFDSNKTLSIKESIERDFNVDSDWEDWNENKDMQTYSSGGFSQYSLMCDKYREKFDVFKEISPMDYFKENLSEITFLGNKIKVHKEFAEILMKIEEDLKGIDVGEITIWQPFQIRPVYNNSKAMSQHALGLAIDINTMYNPMITEKMKNIRFLIKHVTGVDFKEIKKYSIEQIIDASNLFKETFRNNGYERIKISLQAISDYDINNENIKITELRNDIIFNSLSDVINKYVLVFEKIKKGESQANEINELGQKVNLLIEKLNSIKEDMVLHKNVVVYKKNSLNSIAYFTEYIGKVIDKLEKIKLDADQNLALENDLDISNLKFNFTEFKDFMDERSEFYGIISEDINSFIKNLDLELIKLKTDFSNDIFAYGFCNLKPDLIKAFQKYDKIRWGGEFWDFMHFDINPIFNKDIIK